MTASKKHEDCAERANFGMNFVRGMMPTTVARAALIALCAAGFPLLSACSSDDDIDLATYVEQTEPADVLYNQGLANLEQGRLKEAGKKFEAVDRQHPYSEQARKSMVMGAFAQYRQGNYRRRDQHRQALRDVVSDEPGCGLCAVHRRPLLITGRSAT